VLGSDGQSTGIGVGQSTGLGIGGEVSRQRITVVVRCFGIGVGQSIIIIRMLNIERHKIAILDCDAKGGR
jgi:hypothetical protein